MTFAGHQLLRILLASSVVAAQASLRRVPLRARQNQLQKRIKNARKGPFTPHLLSASTSASEGTAKRCVTFGGSGLGGSTGCGGSGLGGSGFGGSTTFGGSGVRGGSAARGGSGRVEVPRSVGVSPEHVTSKAQSNASTNPCPSTLPLSKRGRKRRMKAKR